jgi:signal transduction histidine kinase
MTPAAAVHDSFTATRQSSGQAGEALATTLEVRIDVAAVNDLALMELGPLRIRQVIANLIANALRYAPARTAVKIAVTDLPCRVGVSVMDHGPGIAPEILPNVFERSTRSDDSRGSGLGLAIARRLVEAHGGSM